MEGVETVLNKNIIIIDNKLSRSNVFSYVANYTSDKLKVKTEKVDYRLSRTYSLISETKSEEETFYFRDGVFQKTSFDSGILSRPLYLQSIVTIV